LTIQNNIQQGETIEENSKRYGIGRNKFSSWKSKRNKKDKAVGEKVITEIKEENYNPEIENAPEFPTEEQFSFDEIYRLDGTVEVIEENLTTKQEDPVNLKNDESVTDSASDYFARTQFFKRKLMKGEHLKWTKEIFKGIVENLSNCDDKNRNKLINEYSKTVMNLSMEVLDLKNKADKARQPKKTTPKILPVQKLTKLKPSFVVSVPIQSSSSTKALLPTTCIKTFKPRQQVSLTKMSQ